MKDSIEWELEELRETIEQTCSNNICHATKEMAYSCLATIKRKFEERPTKTKTETKTETIRKENQ